MRIVDKFNKVEKKIFFDRYFNKKTQVAIAESLGISQMTVSRVEKKIMGKLKKEFQKTLE
jgi:RNA polymerase sigma-B factor